MKFIWDIGVANLVDWLVGVDWSTCVCCKLSGGGVGVMWLCGW